MSQPMPPAKSVKALADRAKEAMGILKLVSPLMGRADKLTEAECDMLETAVRKATHLLSIAEMDFYKAQEEAEKTATAVRRNDSNRLNFGDTLR